MDIKNWTELTYQDPLLFLDENISSGVNAEEGLVSLYLPNQTIQFNLNGIESSSNLYPEIGYGGIVKYYVEDDRICCDIHLHISPACNLGYIKLQYELTEEGYEIADMKFKVYEDNRIEYTEIVTATEQEFVQNIGDCTKDDPYKQLECSYLLKQIDLWDSQVGWAVTKENEVLYTQNGIENFQVVKKVTDIDASTEGFLSAALIDEWNAYFVRGTDAGQCDVSLRYLKQSRNRFYKSCFSCAVRTDNRHDFARLYYSRYGFDSMFFVIQSGHVIND